MGSCPPPPARHPARFSSYPAIATPVDNTRLLPFIVGRISPEAIRSDSRKGTCCYFISISLFLQTLSLFSFFFLLVPESSVADLLNLKKPPMETSSSRTRARQKCRHPYCLPHYISLLESFLSVRLSRLLPRVAAGVVYCAV